MPPGLDKAKLDAVVDAAFADAAALTAAFLVLYKGRIVAERSMPGLDRDVGSVFVGGPDATQLV